MPLDSRPQPKDVLRSELVAIEQQMATYEDSLHTGDADIRDFIPRTVEAIQALYGSSSKIEFRLLVETSDVLEVQYRAEAVVTPLGDLEAIVSKNDPDEPTVLNRQPTQTKNPSGELTNRPGRAFKSLHDSLIQKVKAKLERAQRDAATLQGFVDKLDLPIVPVSALFSVRDPEEDEES